MASIKQLFLSEKRIGAFPGWTRVERETRYVWFDAHLAIDGITETGLLLHGGCYANRPEANVTFELRLARTPGRNSLPIERLDWRSLEGGHSNPRRPRSEWSGKRVSNTHLHDFWLNWSETEQRMRSGGLSTAREVEIPLECYTDILTYIGQRLRISDISIVSEPPWLYDLFTPDDMSWRP